MPGMFDDAIFDDVIFDTGGTVTVSLSENVPITETLSIAHLKKVVTRILRAVSGITRILRNTSDVTRTLRNTSDVTRVKEDNSA